MQIRPALAADAPALARHIRMAEIEMVHHFTGTTEEEPSVRVLVGFVMNPTPNRYSLENTLVAEEDGRAAGSIIAFPADRQSDLDTVLLDALNGRGYGLKKLYFEGEPGTWYLSTMGVDPDFRGRGFGTALMGAATDRGRELGFARASLLVSKAKEKARKMYERLGYRIAGDVAIADVEYHRMIKDLAP